MENSLSYSEEALINRVPFLSDFNEINIFVEDENREFEYERIFERLFSNKLTINHIFPMKGKNGVKKAFAQHGEKYDNKPAIYVVDGDFDLILEKDMIHHDNFIYLEKYNIESYYIDMNATVSFMSGKMKKRRKSIIDRIAYETWEAETYNKLQELFINYIIAQCCFPSETNVGTSPYNYIDENGNINEQKILIYKQELEKRVVNYDELYAMFMNKFKCELDNNNTRLICGKYILASLTRYLRKRTNTSFKEEDFRYYLVGEFPINKLDFLKERVENVLEKCA